MRRLDRRCRCRIKGLASGQCWLVTSTQKGSSDAQSSLGRYAVLFELDYLCLSCSLNLVLRPAPHTHSLCCALPHKLEP